MVLSNSKPGLHIDVYPKPTLSKERVVAQPPKKSKLNEEQKRAAVDNLLGSLDQKLLTELCHLMN